MKPLKKHMRKKTVLVLILFVSLVSFILCLPPLIFSKAQKFPSGTVACFIHWPDGTPDISKLDSM